jgi:ATP-binding cassette subfamily G (WHITE) protein 2
MLSPSPTIAQEDHISVDVNFTVSNPVFEKFPSPAPEMPFQAVPFNQDDLDHSDVPKGLHVSFTNLTYTVNTGSLFKKVPYKILTNVSAHFQPGDMTALMGPSGCGKTTLLDVISGRKTSGAIEGKIFYGNSEANKSFLSRNTGYVEQFDTLVDNLTVREMLEYTADMKLPHTKPNAEKRAAVEKIVAKLSLERCCNTVIGNATQRGISGGQAKRVNIGVSIITDPLVLYLDEPTSGLDSFTADEVMTFVKQLSDEGMTVCATIHSPSPYTFHLFKQLLLMVGGRIAYYGINGDPCVNYFMQSGLLPEGTKTPEYYQQAEFIISFVTDAGNKGKRDALADAFENSSYRKEIEMRSFSARNASMKRVIGMLTVEDLEKDNPRKGMSTTVPRLYALWIIFIYKTLKNFKDGLFLSARIVDKFIAGGIIMSLYNNIGGGAQEISSEKSFAAVFFMWSTQPAFAAAGYIPTIMMERALYAREINDGLYDPITYYLSKWIQEIIIAIPVSLIFNGCMYGALSMNGTLTLK